MIKFEKVTKIFEPDLTVLQDITFEVKKGEFVCIVGKSGAGKTTLINLILGLQKPNSGEIFFDGENISNASSNEMQKIRRKIGGIHQDYKLLSNKTVFENVSYIMEVEGKDKEEIEDHVPKILETVGLLEKTNNFPNELSGGEQQRLAVARALINDPEVILADEPTGNLDPYNTYEVIQLLEKMNQLGKTIILSSHDREVVNKLKKRVITLEDGKIIRDEEEGRYII
jgi:cell division transport system ATP-binding protein